MIRWDDGAIPDRDHIVDALSGYAIDYPLTLQAPVVFWLTPTGQVIRTRIGHMRRELGIQIDDYIDDGST